jgi:hypothetical protein
VRSEILCPLPRAQDDEIKHGRKQGDKAGSRKERRDAVLRLLARAALRSSKVDGPEIGGGAEEFEADERVAGLGFYYAGDAAQELFVGLRVSDQEFLRRREFAREREQSAAGADIQRNGKLGERLIVRVGVDEDRKQRGDAMIAAPVRL